MNSVSEGFAKSFEATGKNHLDVELKAITQGRDVTGGKVETFGLIGSMFNGNPIPLTCFCYEHHKQSH